MASKTLVQHMVGRAVSPHLVKPSAMTAHLIPLRWFVSAPWAFDRRPASEVERNRSSQDRRNHFDWTAGCSGLNSEPEIPIYGLGGQSPEFVGVLALW